MPGKSECCRRCGPRLGRKRALVIYKAYQERLKTLNAMDFGDLLLHNLTLFTTQPEIHKEISQRFKYILVDEYQDTNVAQYLWLRLLAQGHRNICCVGDDDQSIYGWRGAEDRQYSQIRAGFSRRDGHPAGAQLPFHRPYPCYRLRSYCP